MLSRFLPLLDAEHDRLILFAPVFMAAGSVGYFTLLQEPSLWIGPLLLGLALCLAYVLRRSAGRYIALAILFSALGFALAQWRTHRMEPVILDAPMNFAKVKGTLENVEQTPKGGKLTLADVSIENLPPERTPKRITLTLKQYDPALAAGQVIAVNAGLFPPPQPALPGGFDFSRYYYFREIGAVGFSMGAPVIMAADARSGGFAIIRQRIGESMRAYFTEPAGSIAAAFVTGQAQAVPEAVNNDMRTAGLYHLLAVSGLNLSIVAGMAFFSVRLLLAAIPALTLRYNIKKWAAVAALLVSYLYLGIAGFPVSAERAFIMVSFIFIAILIDRDPSPMRAVAASAFLILCLTPEAVMTASFQLSYSATAALIASYEWGAAKFKSLPSGFGIIRLLMYIAAVMGTSLVAWLATEPVIIYNFNQFSSYSLLANTIAEPLVSFLLMPLVVAGLLLMPLGLGSLAFTPLQYGVDALIALAHWVASLPYAMIIVPAPTDMGFAVTVAGLILFCLLRTRLRLTGVPLVAAGMLTALAYVPPDILISGDGRHVGARLDDGGAAMIKGRSTSFIAGQWARAFLVEEMQDREVADADCDKAGCAAMVLGRSVAIPKKQEALADDCHAADIILSPGFAVDKPSCAAPLVIDAGDLTQGGAASIRFGSRQPVISYARALQGERPWTAHSAGGK